jgi:predicted kinase
VLYCLPIDLFLSFTTKGGGMKTLYIMRGLPGSGKSTEAAKIGGVICSADDHFVVNGVYAFDPKQLGEAHARCKAKAQGAMRRGEAVVVVDNTNTQAWEARDYRQMARDLGYKVEVVEVGERTPEAIELYAERNTHGVPKAAIERMAARWEDEV